MKNNQFSGQLSHPSAFPQDDHPTSICNKTALGIFPFCQMEY